MDPNGNYRPDKSKAADRVDGIVALLMAIGYRAQGGGAAV
jgi:hypothetical protein